MSESWRWTSSAAVRHEVFAGKVDSSDFKTISISAIPMIVMEVTRIANQNTCERTNNLMVEAVVMDAKGRLNHFANFFQVWINKEFLLYRLRF